MFLLSMVPVVVRGDLLDQDVQVIVNAWNRNFIPWWLLIPQGVSGAIRRRAGSVPFRELSRFGLLALGEAVITGAGRLPFEAIVHVAGLHACWVASERSVRLSVRNAIRVVNEHEFESVAFPIIGGGTGGLGSERALELMIDEMRDLKTDAETRVVRHAK